MVRLWLARQRPVDSAVALAALLLMSFGAARPAKSAESEGAVVTYAFRLTKGTGTPVCDAYLKRLQHTRFERPPYCGRPENDSVPGFALLNRVPLSPEEMLALYYRVYGFMFHADQSWHDQEMARWRSWGRNPPGAQESLANIEASINAGWLKAWRYEPSVDIENNGSHDNLIVWFGEAASASVGVCGNTPSNFRYPTRLGQVPLFLTTAGNTIDVDKTMRVFGHPFPYESTRRGAGRHEVRMIGPEIGIFEYQGTYYFDTFFDGISDLDNKRAEEPHLIDTLGVFLRSARTFKQVCEYEYRSK